MPSSCNNWQSAGTPLNSSICSLRVSTWLRGLVRSENVFDSTTTWSWISDVAFVWSRALGCALSGNKAKCWKLVNVVWFKWIIISGYIMEFSTKVANFTKASINNSTWGKSLLASTVYVTDDGDICIQRKATSLVRQFNISLISKTLKTN